MYKSILIVFTIILLVSCHSTKAPTIKTGMTVEEFQKEAKKEVLVRMDGEWMIYKVIYGFIANNTRFYYFKNNKLVKMDRGERATDYRIRIDTN
jgi:hypothetical protein